MGFTVFRNPRHKKHRPETWSAETPERIDNILSQERSPDIVVKKAEGYNRDKAVELVKTLHSESLIKTVCGCEKRGRCDWDNITYAAEGTLEAALSAVHASVKASDLSLRQGGSFALVRPPGHHAAKNKGGGYCFFNNAGIAAEHLIRSKGMKKVAILDLDAHAGNGTMELFYNREDVLFISLHEDPHVAYPYTGFENQLGARKGYGYTVNVEVPPTSGDREYLYLLKELVVPLIREYEPEALVVSMGFDTHHSDRFSNLLLTRQGYYDIASKLSGLKMPTTYVLEGGYSGTLGLLVQSFLYGLTSTGNRADFKPLDISDMITRETHVFQKVKAVVKSRREVLDDLYDMK